LFLNDQARANSFNVSVSVDNMNFTALSDLDFTSPEASDTLGVQTLSRTASFTLASVIANGASFFIRFSGDDVSGSGSRDEFGFDNLVVETAAGAGPIVGTPGPDTINGLAGDDTIDGLDGDDVLAGLEGDDVLNGGEGNDRLNGGLGADTLDGGNGNDVYNFPDLTDTIIEGRDGGTDEVRANIDFSLAAIDNVENLTLLGNVAVNGTGNSLNNVINGSGANNVLDGGDGDDTLNGLLGNDTLNGGVGIDTLNGGSGNDTLNGNQDGDTLNGGDGVDILNGDAGDDILNGGNAADQLNGGDESDLLNGDSGNDMLNGGMGNDNLRGGSGRDISTGGAGSDAFVFNDGDFAGLTILTADRITDFTQGEDLIDLSGVNCVLGGFSFIGEAAFGGVAGQVRFTLGAGNAWTLVEIDTDGNSTADLAIRLDRNIDLMANDFNFGGAIGISAQPVPFSDFQF
jgi:Ca2+-binding RTX toxin-like protein